ncbi:MAG: hypothetical protein WD934_06255 [Gemmatimonadales bacterium]
MSTPFYVSRSSITRVAGVHRVGTLPTGESIDFGVHGSIKEHYRLDAKDLPLPVDYIVAATGA